MQTEAAILWELNSPWSVEDIELDPPKAGEVLVKLAASGMCHSDEHLVTGDLPGRPAHHRRPRGRRRGARGRPRRHRASRPATTSCSASSRPAAAARPAPRGHQNLCDLGAVLLIGAPDHRRHRPPPRQGPGPRTDVLPRHVRQAHRRERGVVHQDRGRHPARQGLPRRLRRHHRLGLGGLRGRRAARRHRRRRRHRRHRHQRRAGRPPGRRRARSSPSTRSSSSASRPRSSAPRTPSPASSEAARARQRGHLGPDVRQGHLHAWAWPRAT